MHITLDLSTDERIALRRLAGKLSAEIPDAAKTALRDWLIANGYLEILEANEVIGGRQT